MHLLSPSKETILTPFLVEKGGFFAQLANLCEKDYFQLLMGEEHINSKNNKFGFRAPDCQTMNFVPSEDEGDRLDSIPASKVSIHVFVLDGEGGGVAPPS